MARTDMAPQQAILLYYPELICPITDEHLVHFTISAIRMPKNTANRHLFIFNYLYAGKIGLEAGNHRAPYTQIFKLRGNFVYS